LTIRQLILRPKDSPWLSQPIELKWGCFRVLGEDDAYLPYGQSFLLNPRENGKNFNFFVTSSIGIGFRISMSFFIRYEGDEWKGVSQ